MVQYNDIFFFVVCSKEYKTNLDQIKGILDEQSIDYQTMLADKNTHFYHITDALIASCGQKKEYKKIFFVTDIELLAQACSVAYKNFFDLFIFIKSDIVLNLNPYNHILLTASSYTHGQFTIQNELDVKELISIESTKTKGSIILELDTSYHIFSPILDDDFLVLASNNYELENTTIHSMYIDIVLIKHFKDILDKIEIDKNAYYTNENFIIEFVKTITSEQNKYKRNIYFGYFGLLYWQYSEYAKVLLLTILLFIQEKSIYCDKILDIALDSALLADNEKYFLMYQMVRISFVKKHLTSSQTSYKIRSLYTDIYISYKTRLLNEYSFIPKSQRNKNVIFVMTSQFLGLNHAPTKTALDRCYALIEYEKKEVILINTTEFITKSGEIPFFDRSIANVNSDLLNQNSIEYKNIQIPYYQISSMMPNDNDILNILNIVTEYKPYMILHIGSYNLTADLCSNIVPSVGISTVFSSLPITQSQFHVSGRAITEHDVSYEDKFGFGIDNLIYNRFTFDLKSQTKNLLRKDLKIPEDKFVLIVIGARLDYEVSNEFIDMFLSTTKYGTHLVLAGVYNNYVKTSKEFQENSTFVGFFDDMLALCEVCNLYVNPKRAGGGSSIVEAFYKGLPAVTINSGDVYINSGDDFAVGNYEEMSEVIIKYTQDKEFYNMMSQKAIKRAEFLMDTKTNIKELLESIENNKLFI